MAVRLMLVGTYVGVMAAACLSLGADAHAQAGWDFFRTPSGNIHCLGMRENGQSSVRCEIRETQGTQRPLQRPRDCDLDWGRAFAVAERGGTSMPCAGDTVATPNSRILAYGEAFRLGEVSCTSTTAGLECRNSAGRGFFLSRREQRLF